MRYHSDRGPLSYVSHVVQQHRHVPSNGDDGTAQVVAALRATEGTHGPLDGALCDDSARYVQIRFLDRVPDLVQGDAPH